LNNLIVEWLSIHVLLNYAAGKIFFSFLALSQKWWEAFFVFHKMNTHVGKMESFFDNDFWELQNSGERIVVREQLVLGDYINFRLENSCCLPTRYFGLYDGVKFNYYFHFLVVIWLVVTRKNNSFTILLMLVHISSTNQH